MAPNRYYSNTAVETSIASPINSSTTTVTVASASGFPASFPFTLVIDAETASREIVTVTNVAGTTLTVVRGQDNTSAVSHDLGATATHDHTARDFQEPQDHIGSTANVHGTGSGNAVVGTGTTQTLTNKNLTSGTNSFPTTLLTTTGSQTVTNKDLTSGTNTFPTSLATLTGSQTLTNKNLTSATNTFPTSVAPQTAFIVMTADDVAGAGTLLYGGWLKCDGTAVSRTTYADLFAAVGTAYGVGNGTTTFNIPDMRSRFPIGAGTYKGLADNEGDAEASRTTLHTHSISATSHTGFSNTTLGGAGDRVVAIGGGVDGSHNHGGSTGTGLHGGEMPNLALHFLIHI